MTEDQIRSDVASGVMRADNALPLVEAALRIEPSPSWWLLRGHLIQLADTSPYPLIEAAKSYEEAHRLAPDDPEPLEELGHFYDAVMEDRVEAERFYRAALAKGAGETCYQALTELLEEG